MLMRINEAGHNQTVPGIDSANRKSRVFERVGVDSSQLRNRSLREKNVLGAERLRCVDRTTGDQRKHTAMPRAAARAEPPRRNAKLAARRARSAFGLPQRYGHRMRRLLHPAGFD